MYTYADIETTPAYRLDLLDQLRVLTNNLFKDKLSELKRMSAETRHTKELEADCVRLIRKATRRLRTGEKFAVKLKVAPIFKPVLFKVLNRNMFKLYYKIKIIEPDTPYNLDLPLYVIMEKIK